MKTFSFLTTLFSLAAFVSAGAQDRVPRFRHVELPKIKIEIVDDSISTPEAPDTIHVRSVEEILSDTPLPDHEATSVNLVFSPWIFSGFRHLASKDFNIQLEKIPLKQLWSLLPATQPDTLIVDTDNIAEEINEENGLNWGAVGTLVAEAQKGDTSLSVQTDKDIDILSDDITPSWLRNALIAQRIQQDFMYEMMISDYRLIDYAYWDLPVPPRLPADDVSFGAYVKSLNLPEIDMNKAVIPEMEIEKKHWLHTFNTGLQFSQAFLSANWYQGGNDYLALLFNFYWNVQLNRVYHPNVMFESTLSYKLGLNSLQDDKYHKYSISQDLFQYNMKTGFKAFRNWFYSYTLQFKTQMFKSYPSNSMALTSALLSPADLNMGIGMTYSKENKKKNVQFTASIAPISYNLHMCINPDVDRTQYNLLPDQKFKNEIGSNGELNFTWKMSDMVSYKTRLFLFTDYSYFQGDWENTFNFQFSRFFSTQLYANLRYDSTSDISLAPRWHRWMLKEILSVGFSYTFSTKQ